MCFKFSIYLSYIYTSTLCNGRSLCASSQPGLLGAAQMNDHVNARLQLDDVVGTVNTFVVRKIQLFDQIADTAAAVVAAFGTVAATVVMMMVCPVTAAVATTAVQTESTTVFLYFVQHCIEQARVVRDHGRVQKVD